MSDLAAMILHPLAFALVGVLVAIIVLLAVTEKRGAKPFDPWRK